MRKGRVCSSPHLLWVTSDLNNRNSSITRIPVPSISIFPGSAAFTYCSSDPFYVQHGRVEIFYLWALSPFLITKGSEPSTLRSFSVRFVMFIFNIKQILKWCFGCILLAVNDLARQDVFWSRQVVRYQHLPVNHAARAECNGHQLKSSL